MACGPDASDDATRPVGTQAPGDGVRGAGDVIWLTGLCGAGKSTIARLVEQQLSRAGVTVEVLDGDALRATVSADLGFSASDRDLHVARISRLARRLSVGGTTVVVAAISPYREARERARALIGERFVEVHVRASVEECARRDVKGLYARAFAGEVEAFTGVSDPYEAPAAPDVVADTELETPGESAAKVLGFVAARSRLGRRV
jgi:adenylyl-sulfate kinase